MYDPKSCRVGPLPPPPETGGPARLRDNRGWQPPPRAPILPYMQFFARMSPLRALRDLRLFLHQRQPHELGFFALAILITSFFVFAFIKDSTIEKVYRPDIIYVQQWRLDRTEAEILAQQKVDQAKKDKEQAELEKEQAKTRAEFQRLDNKLKRWCI